MAVGKQHVVGVADPETPDEWASYLSAMPVGAKTAAMLPVLDTDELSPGGQVDALRALERHTEWIQAQQVKALARLERDPVQFIPGRPDDQADFDTTVEQVACALHLSHNAAAQRLAEARQLTHLFPSTLGLLGAGKIHYQQARAVVETTVNCPDETATAVEARVLPLMPGQAVSATKRALRKAVFAVDPKGAEQRHQAAKKGRHVTHSDAEDGMAWWGARIAAHDAARMDAALDTHARALKTDGDARTLMQRRADALVGLVTGDLVHVDRAASRPNSTSDLVPSYRTGRSGPVVQVTVSFDTLIGASDDPAELKGYGPITAGQARALATEPGSVWRRLLIEPRTGLLLKTDPTNYKPTAEVERHVIARDRTCAFPNCQMPSHRSDLDHITPFGAEGGKTTPENLMPLCRRHHLAKHRAKWTPKRDHATGAVHWTSPSGHRYTKRPHNYAT